MDKKKQDNGQGRQGVRRDEHGRLIPGTACNNPAGRPTREREYELLSIMRAEATPDKWKEITVRALSDALGGDDKARNWLSKYLLPEPTKQIEIGGTLADLIATLGGEPSTPTDR